MRPALLGQKARGHGGLVPMRCPCFIGGGAPVRGRVHLHNGPTPAVFRSARFGPADSASRFGEHALPQASRPISAVTLAEGGLCRPPLSLFWPSALIALAAALHSHGLPVCTVIRHSCARPLTSHTTPGQGRPRLELRTPPPALLFEQPPLPPPPDPSRPFPLRQ